MNHKQARGLAAQINERATPTEQELDELIEFFNVDGDNGTLTVQEPYSKGSLGRPWAMTLEQIAKKMSVKVETIRQIEASALRKLKSSRKVRELRLFLYE